IGGKFFVLALAAGASVARMSKLRVVVWGENVHEHINKKVARVYPQGMHEAIAEGLRASGDDLEVTTATLQEPSHGLSETRLRNTDVLTWWGHVAHDK